MPTNKPRLSLTVTEEQLAAIEEYQRVNHKKSQNVAIVELITKGLELEEAETEFSLEEYQHIQKCRALDPHGLKMVNLVMEEETERCKKEKKPILELVQPGEPSVDLIEFYPAVSAGRGVDLTGIDDSKQIKVVSNIYTRQADYVVRVDGESMAPRYHHGDKLLVQEVDDTDVGEIGIWFVNGLHYVKKKGEGKLISLNPEFPDVYTTESYDQLCQGRVIGILDPSWIVEE